MRDEFQEVLALQAEFSSSNTAAMQRRGVLIRQEIPRALQAGRPGIVAALGPHGDDLAFEGRDGTGRKTIIPWVRCHSRSRSPNAQRGWYCVYLFHARGAGVFLALIHGSTTFEGGEFRPRPPEELQRLVTWGREVLAGAVAQNPGLAQPVDVRGRELASAYERSIPISRWYPAGALPSDATLFADLLEFATYLRQLHDAERLGQMPMTTPPEVVEVERVAAGPSVPGQGFGLTAAEKRAVELRAMTLARAHLEELGWYVRNTSTNHPYDFECLREDVKMIVEVKGTTSRGESVVLTRNEVAAHRKHHPHNALIVVHSIVLRAGGGVPSAEGGFLVMQSPWTIEDGALRPIAYEYNVTAA